MKQILRITAVLVMAAFVAWIYAEYSGAKLDAPKPGVSLSAAMLEVRPDVEALLRKTEPVSEMATASIGKKYSTKEKKISVNSSGAIDGELESVRLRLTPLEKGGEISWTCESASLQAPKSCTPSNTQ
jgi:hypothetical protein